MWVVTIQDKDAKEIEVPVEGNRLEWQDCLTIYYGTTAKFAIESMFVVSVRSTDAA